MFRRIDSVIGRVAAATVVATVLAGGVAAAGTEPVDPPEAPVETGDVGGDTVAVGVPPVPPTTAEVAVGPPPVPPTTAEVAVAAPPVPPTTAEVAAAPPVPPTTAAPTTVPLDPDVVAEQVTSLVTGAAKHAALAIRR